MNTTTNFPIWLAAFSTSLLTASAQTTFTRVTEGEIVTDQRRFTGCAWGDFNNDGLLDLVVVTYGGTNILYLNRGAGAFQKIVASQLGAQANYYAGAAAGDYDNDGNLDVLVSAGQGAPTARPNVLYHNNGAAAFTTVSGGSVAAEPGYFRAVAWLDYDNDGWLDFVAGNHGDANDDGGLNLLFHNRGDGTFAIVSDGAGLSDLSDAFGIQPADYDGDGFVDLLVLNESNTGPATNFLYHNERNGTFARVLTNAISTGSSPSGSLSAAWGDFNNDGWLDLFIAAGGSTMNGDQNRLYLNNGDGTFTDVASDALSALPVGGYSQSCVWGDYDNDGYLDLFVGNAYGLNGLFHNNGDGTFTQVFDADPVNDAGPGVRCGYSGWVDYDNDGFLDLYFQVWPDVDPSKRQNRLYHNNGNSNAWLEVNCVGTAANRAAIGAKVRVQANIGGTEVWQLREISSSSGGLNVVPLVAHFGLGQATNVDVVRIEWPSGTVEEFQNVAVRQIMTVIEPPRLTPMGFMGGSFQLALLGAIGFQYDLEKSADLQSWHPWATVTATNRTMNLLDTFPKEPHTFYRARSH